jgi:hypothetical protein
MRLHFAYLIQHLEKNGHISLTVLRDGREIKLDMPLKGKECTCARVKGWVSKLLYIRATGLFTCYK